ncbi:MAG: hypothetical protein XXXJIFNMEKO3_00238 [Candidatus Erwinia impunctatus]|nr:hypothetical protein XXXJIFNMEKO_00238 [Culicoides impunctatus]
MTVKPCVIFDVDGTLAAFDPDQVGHWVLGEEKQWDPFFAAMAEAEVNADLQRLAQMLHAQQQAIVICSGRPDSHRAHTEAWLTRHNIPFVAAYLRPDEEDHVPDEEVKARLLQRMRDDGYQPWLVIDDRQAVVDFWRQAGLTCLQCAPGDF